MLVTQGFFQVFGEDYNKTYSPVAEFTSIRTVLELSAQLGLKARQLDVDTAFLNADLKELICVQVTNIKLPDGDDGIYNLQKSPNRLKQVSGK
jgi:Reverse transcriptase (RNA-dependent DNA polymerase)